MTFRIGIDSFSYHRYFGDLGPGDKPLSLRWSTDDFLRRAAQLGAGAVSLQTAFMPSLKPDFMETLHGQLHALRLEPVLAWGHPSGLEGGRNPEKVEDLRRTIKAAGELGCTLVRFVAGDLFYHKEPAPERMERLLPILEEVAAAAERQGVILAMENHGDFGMKDLVGLIEKTGLKGLGICFDGMNAVRVGDDLLTAATLAAPYIRMAHIRDFLPLSTWPTGVEDFWPSAPLGRGKIDIDGLLGFLESIGYEGPLFVEMAYMHPDFSDEDAAVAESIAYLRKRRRSSLPSGA